MSGRFPDERGYLLPMVIIVVFLGALLVLALASFISTSLFTTSKSTEQEWAYYAADAGIEAVLSDLRQGKDALSPSYSPPSVTLNGYTATVTVEDPPRADSLPFGPVFVDPQIATDLSPLGAETCFLYRLDYVRALSPLQINWVFSPADSQWEIEVYEGIGTEGEQLHDAEGNSSPARATLEPVEDEITTKGGTYTIRFCNKSQVPTFSAAFSRTGDRDKTWLRVTAFKDYVITSTAGPITITVFARQGPGPNPAESSVAIMNWQAPY